jgi:hypothetical protein
MGPPPVVTGCVPGQAGPQVPLAEDHHPVDDLNPCGEHESFRISVRSGCGGGTFTASIAASARIASNDAVNCPARSRIGNRKSAALSP